MLVLYPSIKRMAVFILQWMMTMDVIVLSTWSRYISWYINSLLWFTWSHYILWYISSILWSFPLYPVVIIAYKWLTWSCFILWYIRGIYGWHGPVYTVVSCGYQLAYNILAPHIFLCITRNRSCYLI